MIQDKAAQKNMLSASYIMFLVIKQSLFLRGKLSILLSLFKFLLKYFFTQVFHSSWCIKLILLMMIFILPESGILADMYPGGDEDAQSHRRVERSNSTITTLSVDSALSPVSSTCPTSPTSSISPTTPGSTSPTVYPTTRPPESIPEVPCPSPPAKDTAAKTLLTTEVRARPPFYVLPSDR